MKEHDLKSWPQFFDLISKDQLKFDVRKNDRDYTTGDSILLREWAPENDVTTTTVGEYTGREIRLRVTYVLRGPMLGIREGWCVLSLEKWR